MAKFTDAVKNVLIGYFNAGDQPTEAQFTELMTKIQEGIDEHDHSGTLAGDGLATLKNLTSIGVGVLAPNYHIDITKGASSATLGIRTFSDTVGHTSAISLIKSHNDVPGAFTETINGEVLGDIKFYGVDTGPAQSLGARIYAVQRGAAGVEVEADLLLQTYSTTGLNVNQLYLDGGTGYVGIGAVPTYHFDVYGERAGFIARFSNDGDDIGRHGISVKCGTDDPATVGTTYFFGALDGDGDFTGCLKSVNGVFQLADMSDERRKTKIKNTKWKGLDVINKLKVRDFNWKTKPNGPVMTGFVAQEAQKVYPDMVDEMGKDELGTSKGMLIPILTKAIQELDARLTKLGG